MDDLGLMIRQSRSIEGWFQPLDVAVFTAIGQSQRVRGVRGDLLEIGVYMGKSAVVLGHLRTDDELVVCDVFEEGPDTSDARAEWRRHYPTLTETRFVANYRAVHADGPRILRMRSDLLPEHLAPGQFRLIHVDGGHLHAQVSSDVEVVTSLAGDGAVLVFDDISRSGSPGVAAAVWPHVVSGRLTPLLITSNKLYVTTRPNTGLRDAVLQELRALPSVRFEHQPLADHDLVLVTVADGVNLVTGRSELVRRTLRKTRRAIRSAL